MRVLPEEIWIEIFSHLRKRDTRNCLQVCKAWKKTATMLLKDSIHIVLKYAKFKQLLDDLTRYPSIAQKITKLTVMVDDSVDDPMVLRSILNQCSNLLVLKFTDRLIQKFVEMLNSAETRLRNIQRIEVSFLLDCSEEIQQLFTHINYRFRSTITTLVFGAVNDITFNDFESFLNYLSKFEQLTSLKIWDTEMDTSNRAITLDLNEILDVNSHLESLCIRTSGWVYGDLSNLPSTAGAHYPTLKKLRLYACIANISLLTYIRSRFINLQELAFASATIDSNINSVPREIALKTVEDFKSYPVDIYNLDFAYQGKSYLNVSLLNEFFRDFHKNTADCFQSHQYEEQDRASLDDFTDEFFENSWISDN